MVSSTPEVILTHARSHLISQCSDPLPISLIAVNVYIVAAVIQARYSQSSIRPTSKAAEVRLSDPNVDNATKLRSHNHQPLSIDFVTR